MSWGYYYPPYVTVAAKRAKADKKLKALQKKTPNIRPVIIEGRTIARSWWGKSWNRNLENYADYSNRIGRGRSYVRNNAVLDLQIKSGLIESLVQGVRSHPYKIKIKIKTLRTETWKKIKAACQGEFDSLQELFNGKFPESLSNIFTEKHLGLFPSPEEISFECNCPDWADMCKHIAATLYGIGARLDSEPELFFALRNVKMKDLVTGAVQDKASGLLKKAKQRSSRVMDDANLSEMFGIDLEEAPSAKPRRTKAKKKQTEKVSIKTKKKSLKNLKKVKKVKLKKKTIVKKKGARKMIKKKIVSRKSLSATT